MNCVIPGANLKVLSKAVQALSKIGDELHLEAKEDYLIFRTANMTTTAYCTYKFHNSFFSSYDFDDLENIEDLGCMLSMKAVLGVFKSYSHKDKKPEMCMIELEHEATKIIFKVKYKHDVVIVRSLNLNDGQVANVTYNTLASNQISANAQLFTQILANFQLSDEDMGIEFNLNKALFRNYIAGDTNKPKGIRSQFTLTAGEFNSFKIEQETSITYSLKPFRAAIHFAETFNQSVTLNFEKSGRPAVVLIKSPTFDANFVIATLNNDHATQSSLSSTLVSKNKNKQKANKANMTLQDQQALESINWENEFNSEPVAEKSKFSDIINSARQNNNCSDNNKILDIRDVVTDEQPHLGNNEENMVPNSPESPRSKRMKMIFGRCYETTFHTTIMDLGDVLAPDSDPESD